MLPSESVLFSQNATANPAASNISMRASSLVHEVNTHAPTKAPLGPSKKQTLAQLLGYERDPRKRSSPTSD
jgi:hypothetical protein